MTSLKGVLCLHHCELEIHWLNKKLLSTVYGQTVSVCLLEEEEEVKVAVEEEEEEESRLGMVGRQFSPDIRLTLRGLTNILQLDRIFSLLSKRGQCQPVAEELVAAILQLPLISSLSHVNTFCTCSLSPLHSNTHTKYINKNVAFPPFRLVCSDWCK